MLAASSIVAGMARNVAVTGTRHPSYHSVVPRKLPALGLALALIVSACSGGCAKHRTAKVKSGSCPAGNITGAGSAVLDALVQRWIKDHKARCKDASVTYTAAGTQPGIQQLSAGSITFAGADTPMTAEQEQA